MLTSYSIAPLEPGQVLLTLPLAQLLDASLSAERWQEFAREIVEGSHGDETRPSAGLMALRNAKGYFIGLFRYHVQLTLRHGRTLAIDDLVVADEELHATALLVVGKGLRELAQIRTLPFSKITPCPAAPAAKEPLRQPAHKTARRLVPENSRNRKSRTRRPPVQRR